SRVWFPFSGQYPFPTARILTRDILTALAVLYRFDPCVLSSLVCGTDGLSVIVQSTPQRDRTSVDQRIHAQATFQPVSDGRFDDRDPRGRCGRSTGLRPQPDLHLGSRRSIWRRRLSNL